MKRSATRFFAAFAAFLFALLTLAACATPGAGKGAPADSYAAEEPVPFSASVRTGTLPNGLRYYLRENGRPENRILLKLVVNAGSVLEADDEQGLAHFVEHMAFNGTERFPKAALVDYLRSLGMRFGPEANAYTSFDETVYGIEVPAEVGADGSRTVPERALAIMDDWTRGVLFKGEDVESERSIILEEWRMGLGATDRVRRVLLPALFEGSPYAARLPIGLPEVIRSAPAERLSGFFRKWYRPDNMALVVVGDFDAAKLEAGLADRFGGPAAAGPLDRPSPDLPPPARGRVAVAIATDAELGYGFVQLAYKRSPAPVGATLGAYREGLLENLTDRMLALRFLEQTVRPETPYTGAGLNFQRHGATSRFVTMVGMAESGSGTETLRALLREKERLVRYGFSEDEIESAKRALLSDAAAMENEKDRRESDSLAGELAAHFLKGVPVPDVEWEAAAVRELLGGMDKKTVDAFVRTLFESEDLTVMIAAPLAEKASLPDERRVRELVRQSAEEKIEPAAAAAGPGGKGLFSAPPEPGSILAETYDRERDIRVWELSNGARVILKPTKNKNDEIVMAALARGGKTSVADSDAVSAALAPGIADRSGLGSYPLPDLIKLLSGKQVDLSYSVGDYTRSFRGSTVAADLETFFQVLNLSFTEPRVDESAARAYLERVRTLYLQRKENPEAVFSDRVAAAVNGNHPRFLPLTAERLDEVSVDRVRSIMRDQLVAGDFSFAFAGNLDLDRMRSLAETYLASIPGTRTGRDWMDIGMRRPGAQEETVRKGADEKSIVFVARYLPAENAERTAVTAEALSELLDIVLVREIREKLGGVYSISAYASLGAAPRGELSLVFNFSCDPARADELSAAVDQRLAAIAAGGIEPETFAQVVSALKKGREQSLQSNGFIASVLASLDAVHRRPLDRLYGYGETYDSLRPEELSRMAAELLERDRIRVTLYPER